MAETPAPPVAQLMNGLMNGVMNRLIRRCPRSFIMGFIRAFITLLRGEGGLWAAVPLPPFAGRSFPDPSLPTTEKSGWSEGSGNSLVKGGSGTEKMEVLKSGGLVGWGEWREGEKRGEGEEQVGRKEERRVRGVVGGEGEEEREDEIELKRRKATTTADNCRRVGGVKGEGRWVWG